MFYQAFLWVTTNSKNQDVDLASALIEQGYDVGPASSNRSLVTGEEKAGSVILGYRIGWLDIKTMDLVWEDISKALIKCKIQYHSVILAEATDSRWCASNAKPLLKDELN